MDYEILSSLSRVAGIGGASLGVFFLLFRDVIRRNIFSKMSQKDSYRLMRQLLYLVWSVAIVGVLVWAGLQLTSRTANASSNSGGNAIHGTGVIVDRSDGVVVTIEATRERTTQEGAAEEGSE